MEFIKRNRHWLIYLSSFLVIFLLTCCAIVAIISESTSTADIIFGISAMGIVIICLLIGSVQVLLHVMAKEKILKEAKK